VINKILAAAVDWYWCRWGAWHHIVPQFDRTPPTVIDRRSYYRRNAFGSQPNMTARTSAMSQAPVIRTRTHMTGDYFEQVLNGYFQGWRDGYAQALNDVESVIDDDN